MRDRNLANDINVIAAVHYGPTVDTDTQMKQHRRVEKSELERLTEFQSKWDGLSDQDRRRKTLNRDATRKNPTRSM